MGLAEDKNSFGTRVITGNASLSSRVIADGFTNILSVDTFSFASGNKVECLTFFGETAPGTNYNTVGQAGDRYIELIFVSGVINARKDYVHNGTTFKLVTVAS